MPTKRINATRFIRELRKVVDAYANQIQHDDDLRAQFKKKMEVVCTTASSAEQKLVVASGSLVRVRHREFLGRSCPVRNL